MIQNKPVALHSALIGISFILITFSAWNFTKLPTALESVREGYMHVFDFLKLYTSIFSLFVAGLFIYKKPIVARFALIGSALAIITGKSLAFALVATVVVISALALMLTEANLHYRNRKADIASN